jgi:hypothetical protein
MPHLSKDQIEEIARALASRSKKDTDFVDADALTDNDYVAIVQDGKNKKVKVSHFESHSNTEWGTELNHEVDLKVRGTAKRLLKTSAISTSDKNVDVVTDPEAVAMMKILGIYMEI